MKMLRRRFLFLVLLLPAGLATTGLALAQDHVGRYEQTDIEFGARLYNMHCIACHGENGDLLPQINLRNTQFPNSPSDLALGQNIRNGLPGTAMVATSYSDAEITALVAYVRNNRQRQSRLDRGSAMRSAARPSSQARASVRAATASSARDRARRRI